MAEKFFSLLVLPVLPIAPQNPLLGSCEGAARSCGEGGAGAVRGVFKGPPAREKTLQACKNED